MDWAAVFQLKHNLSEPCEGKDSTLEITVEETSAVLNFSTVCELIEPNPDHSI